MSKILKWTLAKLLRFLDPHKPYGTSLFNAITRVTVTIAIEAVALRQNSETGKTEVYLIKRAKTDTAYPGLWHVPGSILRPKERDLDVLKRLSRKEFHANVAGAEFVAMISNPGEHRGHFISLVYVVRLEGEPEGGEWFDVEKLPSHTVLHHKDQIIPIAAKDPRFDHIPNHSVKTLEL